MGIIIQIESCNDQDELCFRAQCGDGFSTHSRHTQTP
jgi:hypothetical protein